MTKFKIDIEYKIKDIYNEFIDLLTKMISYF